MKKMEISLKMVVFVILFLPPTHAVGQPFVGLPSVLVEEGKMAEISCLTVAGSHSEYFWRKGESLHNSTEIAFFISGLPTDGSGRFIVTQNGTLIVKKVTLADEGKYICRVSSEESDCHGEVFVFVQAVLQDFHLKIEYCEPEDSCVISTESKIPTSLTCKATNTSPSMKLKWFNGSREIKDNIEESSLANGTSREISSTIKYVYKSPSTLTCQAVDFKTINDHGMFAHILFRTPASTADISPGWMVTAILFIVGFAILFLIIIFITVWPKVRNGKDVETQNSAERESLLSKDIELKEKREQILKLKKQFLDLERNARRFRSRQIDLKDPICINCRLITSRTGDYAPVATKEDDGQAKKSKRDLLSKDAKFHTVYHISAKPIDLCTSIADFVENAIDGKKSCLIAHDVNGREHFKTMFGPDGGASNALVPYAIATIFRRIEELTSFDYKVDVKARFMDNTTSTPTIISQQKVAIANEKTANELLKQGLGKIVQMDGTIDHFVQFYIETKTDQGTRTGFLVLGTFRSIQMIKECFRSVEPTTQLTRNISEITSDGRCRSVLITHINGDKLEETNDCLAMVYEISKKNKK